MGNGLFSELHAYINYDGGQATGQANLILTDCFGLVRVLVPWGPRFLVLRVRRRLEACSSE